MIDITTAIKILEENTDKQNEYLEIDLLDADGYIIYEDIYSEINVPEFPKSAMDGYAVNYYDLEKYNKFEVITEIFAGEYKEIDYISGTAIRVMTGSYIPKGYNTVIMQEHTDYGEEYVTIYKKSNLYANYCHIGEDIKKGESILKSGTLLKSIHMGILGSLGISKIKVIKPLTVSLISTGSELLYPGEKFEMGKSYASTSLILNSYLKKYNIKVDNMIIVKDDVDSIIEKIEEFSKNSDIIITTGGVSVGKYDLIPEVYNKMSSDILFRKVAMKPGTPVSVAKTEKSLILSLSGNPFAALANFQVLFWPIAAKYYNCLEINNTEHEKTVKKGNLKSSGLQRYVRAKYTDGFVELEDINAASILSNMLNCNCLIIQEPNTEIKEGDKVKVIYLP